jgi:hypothetical protein
MLADVYGGLVSAFKDLNASQIGGALIALEILLVAVLVVAALQAFNKFHATLVQSQSQLSTSLLKLKEETNRALEKATDQRLEALRLQLETLRLLHAVEGKPTETVPLPEAHAEKKAG